MSRKKDEKLSQFYSICENSFSREKEMKAKQIQKEGVPRRNLVTLYAGGIINSILELFYEIPEKCYYAGMATVASWSFHENISFRTEYVGHVARAALYLSCG